MTTSSSVVHKHIGSIILTVLDVLRGAEPFEEFGIGAKMVPLNIKVRTMINRKTVFFVATMLIAGAYKTAQADQSQPLSLGPFELLPSGKGMLMIGAGGFDALWTRDSVGEGASALLNVEYRFGKKLFYLGVVTGGLVNSDSGGFVYVGNYVDIRYKRFIATPVLSVGAYSQGAGPDLGGTLEFRSSITLAYELENKSRIGVGIAHISNASIHDENPGENEILVSYSFHF